MKKIILTSVFALAVTGAAFAQGKFNWSIISPAGMTAQTNATSFSPLFGGGAAGGTTGNTAATAGGFNYALLYTTFSGSQVAQPGSLAALGTWAETGLTAVNGSASRLTVSGTTGTSVTVPWAAGVTQSVMMVGWSANLGSSWATALATLNSASALGNVVGNAFFGMSNTGFLAAGAADPGTTVFAAGGQTATSQGLPVLSLLTPLYLVPVAVPEPATIALAGLGGLALLALRRKK